MGGVPSLSQPLLLAPFFFCLPEVSRLVRSSDGLVGVCDLTDTFCMDPWVEEELLSLAPPSPARWEEEEEDDEERGMLPPATRAS